YAEKDVSLIVDGDALHVFQLAPERGNCFQLFTGRVDVELAVMTVSDVQRSPCEIDSLGRESIVAIDDAMQFAACIEQVKDVVFVVGDVQIAAVVKDHAFRLGDSVLLAKKIGNLSVARDAENFVLFAVAHEQRSIRREGNAFSCNQSRIFAGNNSGLAVGGQLPKPAGVVIGEKDVVLRIDDQIF